MSYLFRQKFKISDLAQLSEMQQKILILESEPYLAALYARYLSIHNFLVEACRQSEQLLESVALEQPHLLIVGIASVGNQRRLLELLRSLKLQHPALPIITIGYNLEPAALKQLISGGVAGHLDRRLSRPQDLVLVVKTVLHH